MPALTPLLRPLLTLPRITAVAILIALLFWVWSIGSTGAVRNLSFSLSLGLLFGIVLQRSKFCFFCMTREFIDERDSRGLIALLAALAVGTLGYVAVYGAILPVPSAPRLPPDAHIGPVSWVLALAAFVFGSGMALSGSCVSAHLYRLGEGSVASVFALLGVLIGFIGGFISWNSLYLRVVQEAPVIWLPNYLGYGGTVLLQLLVLAVLAIALFIAHKEKSEEKPVTAFSRIFEQRWPAYVGGLLIGFIGTLAFFRVAPLGVTAELGSIARTVGSQWHWLPERLEGLDSFSGCATVVKETLLSNNGLFVAGLVLASLASALFAGQFKPEKPKLLQIVRNFSGGILMGWGSMTALGCTVGTLLSGIMAGALSGWVFAVFCLAGLWITWLIRKRFA